MSKTFLKNALLAAVLMAMPVSVFAADAAVTKTVHHSTKHHKHCKMKHCAHKMEMTKEAPVNYEDSRAEKWASMTAEEKDLAKQRGDVSYKNWQEYQAKSEARKAYNEKYNTHHPDPWAGKTAEEKDAMIQRNSAKAREIKMKQEAVKKHHRHHAIKVVTKPTTSKDTVAK